MRGVPTIVLALLLCACSSRPPIDGRAAGPPEGSAEEVSGVALRATTPDTFAVHPVAPPAPALAKPTGPDRAFKWRRMAWVDEHGSVTADDLERGRRDVVRSMAWSETHSGGFEGIAATEDGAWFEHGPSNVAGRTRSLVIHPTQTNRMWAGSVGGGIFSTQDGGATWTPINDWASILPIGSLAIDPANPNIIYAGTGEGQFNGDALGGDGILKSTDGGVTWPQLASTDGWDTVNRIAIAPGNSNLLLASKRYGGIRRSTNGGMTWTTPYSAQGSFDVQFHPTDATKAVAHVIDYDFGASNWFHRVLYSNDGGMTWQVAAGLSYVADFGSRIELAYAPSSPNIVYALSAAGGGVIWKSTDGGQSYALVTTTGQCGSSWYASPLWVHPTNPDFLLCGGYHVHRSTNGGVTLEQASNGYILTQQAHPDIHGFVQDPGFNGSTNRRVYVVSDGGVHVADDVEAASTTSGWASVVNGYRSTQFYGASAVELPVVGATPVSGAQTGLTAKYYTLVAPTQLPNFDALTPLLTTSVTSLNYPATNGNFANSGKADNVGALFTGWLDVPTTGLYTLYLESDDGSKMFVDGAPVVLNDGLHAMVERSGLTGLAAGKHALRVEFFEAGGGAGLIMRWAGPGIAKQVVPAANLLRNGTAGEQQPSAGSIPMVYGGTQDNGSLRTLDMSTTANLTFGGDGGFCAVDWQVPLYAYGEYVDLKIHRSSDGGQSAGYIYGGLTDAESGAANFIAPFILDPNDPKRLYGGGASLWRTNDARAASVQWTAIRPAGSSNISAIAAAPGHPEIVWIAQNNGEVWKSVDALAASPTWTAVDDNAVTNPLPNRYCTRLLIDEDDPQLVYACFGGFANNNIWKTTNGGMAWTKITGSGPSALPAIPVRGIARHPDDALRLYAGTELGICSTNDGGLTWSTSAFGPANVSVDELVFAPGSTRLVAATHGRGLWSIDLPLPTADLDGDGVVNGADLALLLAAWGTAGPGDLDGNGVVNGGDLALLLAAWG